jgi:predicted O-linked N-acetylglucosamine transferase (SPINDLY family)
MLADITLDSLGWSGANTTFEGLELGGLIITCAGQFMRGRHTSGCLMLMGVPELITKTREEYVTLAVRLARDPALRQHFRDKLRAALPTLHADPPSPHGVGDALNAFYGEVFKA